MLQPYTYRFECELGHRAPLTWTQRYLVGHSATYLDIERYLLGHTALLTWTQRYSLGHSATYFSRQYLRCQSDNLLDMNKHFIEPLSSLQNLKNEIFLVLPFKSHSPLIMCISAGLTFALLIAQPLCLCVS